MRADYERIFEAERRNEYPAITAFEARMGYAIERARLEEAARTLACPLKASPPCWQHGRVVYSALRAYLASIDERVSLLDIGTAKGFSALCMAFALEDSGVQGAITSVDVIDPQERVARNSVADLGALQTVTELVSPWPEAQSITFLKSTGAAWLKSGTARIHFAFVDGKHSYQAVREEAQLLSQRQELDDVTVFDDLQIPGVRNAVVDAKGYRLEFIEAKPGRQYAIAARS